MRTLPSRSVPFSLSQSIPNTTYSNTNNNNSSSIVIIIIAITTKLVGVLSPVKR